MPGKFSHHISRYRGKPLNAMPVPLPILLPAAAASLAYLNAKSSIWYDARLIKSIAKAALRVRHGLKHDTINLFYTLETSAQDPRLANQLLLIFDGRTYTYAQAYDKVLRYGHWIRSRFDVKPKDVVAMDFENSDTFIFIWFALWSIGAKPAFINYNLSGKPLSHCIEAAKTKLCLIDPAVASKFDDESVKQALPNVNFVVFTPEAQAEASSTAPERAPNSARSDDSVANMAMLIYTSGTTGLPKPAVVSWGKCIYGGSMASTLLGRGNGDIMYTVSAPLSFSSTRQHINLTRPFSACPYITLPLLFFPSAQPSRPAQLKPSAASFPPRPSGTIAALPRPRRSSTSVRRCVTC